MTTETRSLLETLIDEARRTEGLTAPEFDYAIATGDTRALGALHATIYDHANPQDTPPSTSAELAERTQRAKALRRQLAPEIEQRITRCREQRYTGWSRAAQARGARIEYAPMTATEAAAVLGVRDGATARRQLRRWGVDPIGRGTGRGGENLYDAEQVRAAAAEPPRRGRPARTRHTTGCPPELLTRDEVLGILRRLGESVTIERWSDLQRSGDAPQPSDWVDGSPRWSYEEIVGWACK